MIRSHDAIQSKWIPRHAVFWYLIWFTAYVFHSKATKWLEYNNENQIAQLIQGKCIFGPDDHTIAPLQC